jgi:pyrroline-5-carboxylate reductase
VQLFVRTNELMAMARSLAELDVASAMALLARTRNYCRPTLVQGFVRAAGCKALGMPNRGGDRVGWVLVCVCVCVCVAGGGGGGGFAGGVTVLLAIKPQVFAKSGVELARELGAVGRVVSVMAGVEAGSVAGVFGGARVVRTMPNLPALVGQGCTAIAAGPGAGARDVEWVERVFGAVGRVVRIDESLMDAFTALAGSGPAYLFYLAEIMRDAGIAMGMEPGDADAAARQTLAGAAAMLASSSARPEELRAGVTSPGGTTAAAIAALEAAGVKAAWMKAIAAARDRGAELAKLAREAGRG